MVADMHGARPSAPVPAGPGPDRPSSARIHNLWLGGSYHGAADEAKAAEIERICPRIRQMAADSRLFTGRVVAWAAADLGIGQFLDLGAGLAPDEPVHEMARSVRPGARVAYADRDPEVCDYLLDVAPGGRDDGVGVALADLSQPARVLADHAVRSVIDLSRPVAILATLVLQQWAPARARAIIRGYARRLAPGSVIAVSTARISDEGMWQRLAEAYAPFPAHNVTTAEAAALLGGLELVPPGVCTAAGLRPGWGDAPEIPAGPCVIAAIGRKP